MARNARAGRTRHRRTAALIACAAAVAGGACVYAQRHREELEELGRHHLVPAEPQT